MSVGVPIPAGFDAPIFALKGAAPMVIASAAIRTRAVLLSRFRVP